MIPFARAFESLCARSVYKAQEAILRRPTFRLLRELRLSDSWSREQIEALQIRRLNELLGNAQRHSPWHADRIAAAGLTQRVADGAITLEDLRELPTMNKQDVRENLEDIVWRGVPGGAYRYTTGGSSGEPLIFYYGRDRQAADAAGRMRARGWWGLLPGEREAYLWGAPVELNRTDRLKGLRDRLVNHRLFNAFELNPPKMRSYLAALREWQPSCLYGYASSLALLAEFSLANNRGTRLPALKVVCTTGEPLFPHQRQLIESAFGAPVANEYGCRDGGLVAHEAPDRSMRTMRETILVELLDERGNAVSPGSPGEVVITNLMSAAQPFIRYRTGDIGTAHPSCAGQPFASTLADVEGRSTDFVVRADGTAMHALSVIYEIRGVEGVGAFKCTQLSLSELQVQIVPNRQWTSDAGEQITRGLRARLGEKVEIKLALVEQIPSEASGKHRYVVSHVPLPPAATYMDNSAKFTE